MKAVKNQLFNSEEKHNESKFMILTPISILHQNIALVAMMKTASILNEFTLLTQLRKRGCNDLNAIYEHIQNARSQKKIYICASSADKINR